MMSRMTRALLFVVIGVCLVAEVSGQGIILPATGAVNRGMAGATTGAAIESIGSMSWNPATISGLDNELGVGFEALYSIYDLDSTFPAVGTGTTSSETGAVPIPSVAWVHRLNNPNITLGVGLFAVAGYTSNFPTDPTNPILTPPPAAGGVGLGRVQGEAVFFQMPLAISFQLTDKLAVAFGPTMTMGKLPLDENALVPPNANGLYPRGNGTRYHFGGGGQLGFYYVPNCCWSFGANIKSPSWMEPLRYHSEDAAGLPRVDEINIDLPMMITVGSAFRPNEDILLTSDFRFTDYNNSEGLGEPAAFRPDFSVDGLGWRSIFSAHFGARLRMTERFYSMFGYMYSNDIITGENAFFNVGSDLGYQHGLAAGGSFVLSESATISFAYNYFPEWGSTGPFVAPGIGPVPGSSVTNRVEAHSATFGVNVKY